jgi:hypothetical protein
MGTVSVGEHLVKIAAWDRRKSAARERRNSCKFNTLRKNEHFWAMGKNSQFDPEPVYTTMTAVAAGEVDSYRNLEPKSMIAETKSLIEAPWTKKVRDGLGTRPASLQKSYEMKPETPVSESLAAANN